MEAFKCCIYNWLIFTYTELFPVHYFIYLYFKEGLLLWGKWKSLLPWEVQSEVSPSTCSVCFLMFPAETFLLWPQQHFYSNSELTHQHMANFINVHLCSNMVHILPSLTTVYTQKSSMWIFLIISLKSYLFNFMYFAYLDCSCIFNKFLIFVFS